MKCEVFLSLVLLCLCITLMGEQTISVCECYVSHVDFSHEGTEREQKKKRNIRELKVEIGSQFFVRDYLFVNYFKICLRFYISYS